MKRKEKPSAKVYPFCSCLCKPGVSIGEDRLSAVLRILAQLDEPVDAEELLIESPHRDAQRLLSSLPDSKLRRNVQIATNMPESINPFVECEHDQVISVEEGRQWFRQLGFTA